MTAGGGAGAPDVRPPKGGVSSFPDLERAERAVADALTLHAAAVEEWLGDPARPGPLPLRADLPYPTGRHVPLGSTTVQEVDGVRVVLVKDDSMPQRHRVLLAYPVPRQGDVGVGLELEVPALAQLCGAGLHQDFWESDGPPGEVVRRLAGADPGFADQLDRDVRHVRELAGDDPSTLDAILDGLGNNYDYAVDELDAVGWLGSAVTQAQSEGRHDDIPDPPG